MSGGWGCPHEADGKCQRVENKTCDPGMTKFAGSEFERVFYTRPEGRITGSNS